MATDVEAENTQNTYMIRPNFKHKFVRAELIKLAKMAEPPFKTCQNINPVFQKKTPSDRFRPAAVKSVIHEIVNEELNGKQYNAEETVNWTKAISDTIKNKLKEMEYDRYKFVVQVVIGEQRGEGVKFAARCLWDSDTDNFAQDVFMNETMFCVVAAYAVYYY